MPDKLSADVIVVGSGPGGATVARGLAQANKKVILLERGKDWRRSPLYGTYPGALLYTDRNALLFTHEGLNIIRPLMAGGATSMFCGCAARPPAWFKEKYKVDLDRYIDETIEELQIAPLPPELRGAASTRVADAARTLGYDWVPLPKFMRPAWASSPTPYSRGDRRPGTRVLGSKRAEVLAGNPGRPAGPSARNVRFDCGAKCMLGCRCGAKWNAAEWVDEAIATGCCQFITEFIVDALVLDNRKVAGVQGRLQGRRVEVRAPAVVLAAGGIGTPLLLQRAGLAHAGQGMGMDTTVMVYGASKSGERGNGDDPPMTYEWANDEVGYLLSTLIDPWLNYPLIMLFKGPQYLPSWARWHQTLGIMIKLKDDVSGHVLSERDISKPFTPCDQKKLDHALGVANRILTRAGADPQTRIVTPLRGTHPCATVRLGHLLDTHLQTEIENLYVCDASAFPESLARPTVLTIIGLGKRLVDHLSR